MLATPIPAQNFALTGLLLGLVGTGQGLRGACEATVRLMFCSDLTASTKTTEQAAN